MNEVHAHREHVPPALGRDPLVLHVQPAIDLTSEQFFALCQLNRDLRLERTAKGDIIVLPPTGAATGARNLRLGVQVSLWAERDGSGVVFGSSTGFELPNGATRSPDVAWVRRTRLAQLTPQQKERFLPLCPDFVIELLSPSDSLPLAKEKMHEYVANGTQLGWLIDPEHRRVFVYRSGAATECLDDSLHLTGEPLLKGFTLDLLPIWDPGF
ncbi:MAG: Uma2 family endonuclease [Candidatus Binatia bacterium]